MRQGGGANGDADARALAAIEEGRIEDSITILSEALRDCTAVADNRRAALVSARLGWVFDTFGSNRAAAKAWFSRAERLIAEEPDCVERGWVALAGLGCDVDDPADLAARAELALACARTFGDVVLEAKALADGGLARVQAGELAEGMAMLDEANALWCGPAADRNAATMGVCSFFTACYYAADFERAEAWIDDLRRVGIMGERSTGPVWITGHCESVQATALIELGRWTDAESLLTSSLEAFETATGWPAWHPAIALADLRTRQGRLAEAEALLAGKDAHMQALLPTARLRLALGEYELATATARRGLRMVGGDRLRGVDLLTIVIEAEARAGRLAEAEEAWRELESRDGSPREPGLAARVAHARSAVLMATGDVGQAITVVETAAASLAGGKWLVLQLMLTLDLLALHTAAGNDAVAAIEAKRAQALLTDLDVTLPEATLEILNRHLGVPASITGTTARLRRIDGRWVAETTGTVVRLRATKGLLYLAELLAAPGVERHVIDLVDRVEGVDRDGVDRKQIGHAGEVADATARASYRTRIEALRTQIDEALESEDDERVASLQAECDALVGELAAAFGLGGRGRLVSSAAERARLNVTRAIRTAIAGIAELLPHEGGVLDERVRTGMYCAFEPARTDLVHWSFSSD